jgi:hypothetical protein
MNKYTKEKLENICKTSNSVSEVIRKLGLKEAGGTHTYISKKIKEFGIDTSHFLGKRANCGNNHSGGPKKLHWSEVLIKRKKGKRQKSVLLRRSLLEYGRDYKCFVCGQDGFWNGKPLMLQIEHKNRDWLDDRPENIEFICGHCHSQTIGWCGSTGNVEIASSSSYSKNYRNKKRSSGGKAYT